MSQVVAIIPARSGSKSIPDKNIKHLAGKPLIAYSIAAARLAKNIDRVIVSTDSQKYADIAAQYGAEVPFLRPVKISGDTSTDYLCIKHALDWLQDQGGSQPEYLVHLRPTTPLRDSRCIEDAIELLRNNEVATALRSVHEMSESAYKTMEIETGFLKRVFCGSFDLDAANDNRQRFSKTYHPNGYVDIIRSSFVRENQKLHGNCVLAYISESAVEVDTINDFAYLEYKVASNPSLVNRLFE